jgi:hypothetical protein
MVVTGSASIDNRKDLLLLVLAAAGGEPVTGVTRLQKYLYLLQEQEGWGPRLGTKYDFRAYDFGPFDDQIYADLEFLENVGLIRKDPEGEEPPAETGEQQATSDSWGTSDPEFAPWEYEDATWVYRLTDKGRDFVEQQLPISEDDQQVLNELKQTWNGQPLASLLRWLYHEHPETATNTKLTHLKA